MYVQVFHTTDKDLMTAVHDALKERFASCRFTISALEGKPLKLNLEGAEDERDKVQFATTFSKEWLKNKKKEEANASNKETSSAVSTDTDSNK